MNVVEIICFLIIIALTIYGYYAGLVKILIPIVSQILTFLVMLMLRSWAFGFLFKWALFQGEHIISRVVVVLIVFIGGYLLFRWALKTIGFISKLPLVRTADQVLGVLAGFIEGLLLVGLFIYLTEILCFIPAVASLHEQVQASSYLIYLVQNNPIKILIELLVQTAV